MLMSVGASLFDDFGKNDDRERSAVIMFADFLTGIHNKIADEGIMMLAPSDPTDIGWRGDLVQDVFVPGVIMGTSDPPNIDRMTFVVGAVELFSGYSAFTVSPTFVFGTVPTTQQQIYRKLQIRAVRGMMKVYGGVGLLDVSSTINKVNGLAGRSPISIHRLARWSFREVLSIAGIAAQSDGFFHLSNLASFIDGTPPLDAGQGGDFLFGWRQALEPF